MPVDVSRVSALCFDIDGTLCDTDDFYVARLAAWLRSVPFMRRPEQAARRLVMWLESPGNFLMGLADTLTIDDELLGVISWLYRNARPSASALTPIRGVIPMLERMRHLYPMAVVSARDELSTLSFLQSAGIRSYFKVIISALSAPRTKPYPDPILLAARHMGVAPDACLMIGDTSADIRAGRSAGAQTVGVLCGFGEPDELRRCGADLILASTADLPAALAEA